MLAPLVRGEPASFAGETLAGHATLDVQGASPVPILVAALGSKMLQLTGRVADGTVTWMTGPATLASHVVPTISAAAAGPRSPGPRVGVGLPVCVTSDVDSGPDTRGTELPGVREPAVLPGDARPGRRRRARRRTAMVGDEDGVRAQVEHLAGIGATDFVANVFGSGEERTRTWALLQSMT